MVYALICKIINGIAISNILDCVKKIKSGINSIKTLTLIYTYLRSEMKTTYSHVVSSNPG